MSTNSAIEWTEATWNPVVGCTRVSAGCDHCYAVTMTNRLAAMGQAKYAGLTVLNAKGDRHFNGVVRTDEASLLIPLKRKKPTVYFVNSMSDLFHKAVPFDFIDRVFAVMALTPRHTFQILTKRPVRMAQYFADRTWGDVIANVRRIGDRADAPRWAETFRQRYEWDDQFAGTHEDPLNGSETIQKNLRPPTLPQAWPLPGVWLGTSCENQAAADQRIPHLLRCPAAVRFLSCEPLLGAIDITNITAGEDGGTGWTYRHWDALTGGNWCDCQDHIHPLGTGPVSWVIVGGESGPGARPFNVQWARDIIGQCKAAGVACFVKQLGAMPVEPWPAMAGLELESFAGGKPPPRTLRLRDKKGGDPAEWDEDLRVREFPMRV